MQHDEVYGLKAKFFKDAMDRIEATRQAVSKQAEERAHKYKDIIVVANDLQEGVQNQNVDEFNYEALKLKYERLRDFKELKYSKFKNKVEVNLAHVLKEI